MIIEVPTDAKVYIDGNLTKSRNDVRHFYTPELDPRQTYFYDVRVEYSVNGRAIRQDKRVYVQAGDVLRESFPPAGAKLTNIAKN